MPMLTFLPVMMTLFGSIDAFRNCRMLGNRVVSFQKAMDNCLTLTKVIIDM